MNMHGMPQPGVVPSGVGVSPIMMQQASPQMGQMMGPAGPQQPPQPAPIEKIDNISKAKSLVGPLRESLSATIKAAAQNLHHNNMTDIGTIKGDNSAPPRFDKYLEEFYSICDQIELHLKTSIQCIQQSNSSNHFLPLNVAATRVDPMPHPPPDNPMLSYPQYLSTVRSQIAYAKEIHDTLICAAQNISPSE
ncbi:mediator of RNA polymerase II transcription subunit 29 [Lutzomyia longipalpis]|uniref:mediator of RNA polymerase II transcription subunit 29 n=1 Tax=Lutzomyia longipalpis TaxID=7200 RepID=UPI0024837915|nr:mediator of RNA polymerase II transcription subunit 29 [Lutzomyia longipalpis]